MSCFGLESEFAIHSPNSLSGARVESLAAAECFLAAVAKRLAPSLPFRCPERGIMCEAGRFYIDGGGHPEFCTAEATSPDESLRLLAVGRTAMIEAAADLGVELFSANTDHQGSSWGCHENISVQRPADIVVQGLVSHLISRVIYTGAGGLGTASGISFSLSPREAVIRGVFSEGYNRFFSNREALDHRSRVHLVCGENNLSGLSNWLKMGTTAALVHLIDHGTVPDAAMAPLNPIKAMHVFSHDPSCTAAVPTPGGDRTAIEIQRYLVYFVRQHLTSLPDWASRLVNTWDDILDRIEFGGIAAVDKMIDWPTKYCLFQSILQANGTNWEELKVLNSVIHRIAICVRGGRAPRDEALRFLIRDRQRLDPEVRKDCEFRLATAGLSWDAVEQAMSTRWNLCAADLKYGYLFPAGTHSVWSDAGVMNDAPPPKTAGEYGVTVPRVEMRNRAIRKLAGLEGAWANWKSVGKQCGRTLDLSDPFSRKARWKRPKSYDCRAPDPLELLRRRVRDLMRAGRYETASRLVRTTLGPCPDWRGNRELARQVAWNEARRGRRASAISVLNAIHDGASTDISLAKISDYQNVLLFSSFSSPPLGMRSWIDAGRAISTGQWCREPLFHSIFLEYSGAYELQDGGLSRAEELLKKARKIERSHAADEPRVQARILIWLAECARRLGNFKLAARRLQRAQILQREAGCTGDYANMALPMALKLAPERTSALAIVNEAFAIQQRESLLGRARTLLIAARVCGDPHLASGWRRAILYYKLTVPALAESDILSRILDSWTSWVVGQTPEGQDRFWGL